ALSTIGLNGDGSGIGEVAVCAPALAWLANTRVVRTASCSRCRIPKLDLCTRSVSREEFAIVCSFDPCLLTALLNPRTIYATSKTARHLQKRQSTPSGFALLCDSLPESSRSQRRIR